MNQPRTPESSGRQDISILVVDDEAFIRQMLGRALSHAGYRCHVAADGKEAMKKLHEAYFNLVLTDINMPEMDGLTLTAEVRRASPRTEVIIFSGMAASHSFTEFVQAGALDFLSKPFDLSELLFKVERVAREQKRERDLQREISLRLKAEESLRQLEKEYQRLLERAGHEMELGCSMTLAKAVCQGGDEADNKMLSAVPLPGRVKNYLKGKLGLDDAAAEKLLIVSRERIASSLEHCEKALTHNDFNSLSRFAQNLKGEFYGIGLEESARLAERIERREIRGGEDLHVGLAGRLKDLRQGIAPMLIA